MSKKRSKAAEVRGLQVILLDTDEKKDREKDALMERMQRRMGTGCGVAASLTASTSSRVWNVCHVFLSTNPKVSAR